MQSIHHDGSYGPIQPFDQEEMDNLLSDPNVKEVRVFKLQPGMEVVFQGRVYKVKFKGRKGRPKLEYVRPYNDEG